MTYRLQNLMLAMLLALSTLFMGLGNISQNLMSGGYQLFERAEYGIITDNHLNALENFDSLAKTASECCNGANRTPSGSKAAERVTWTDEGASMSPRARAYDDGAMGSRSNIETQRGQAPALTRTREDGSTATVRFDGVDGDILIDRKISVVTTPKAKDQAARQSAALAENGLTGRWEVPTQAQANRANRVFEELGIENITVRVVPE